MDSGTWAGLAGAAFGAGVMNAVAGGGTLLTFPALDAVLTASAANATSTIALLPGSIAGMWGYRSELRESWPTARKLMLPSILGGLLGAGLMVAYPEGFRTLVPWLILTAAVLFLIQQPLSKYLKKTSTETMPASRGHWLSLALFQFGVATYGGYFGAGIGILMLAALGFMNIGNIHRMNAVKTMLASTINLVTVFVFLGADVFQNQSLIDWPYAAVMATAAIVGGYTGARVARRLPVKLVRGMVILIAFSLAGYYFAKQAGWL
ncbi:MAG: sulfite exporter TauE/SafE family protein [Fimbriiglobus sp.]